MGIFEGLREEIKELEDSAKHEGYWYSVSDVLIMMGRYQRHNHPRRQHIHSHTKPNHIRQRISPIRQHVDRTRQHKRATRCMDMGRNPRNVDFR